MANIKKTAGAVASVFDMIGKKKVAVYAAASDYFLFMSLVPILMLLVSLIRYLPFDQADVLNVFASAVPESVYNVISPIVGSIYRSGGGVITVSILLTLFSASSAMRAIMKGLDAVYEVVRRDNVVVFFARAVVYMLILVIIIIISLGVMVYGGVISDYLREKLPQGGFFDRLFSLTKYMRYLLVLAILTLSFLLLYRWVPAGTHRTVCQWPGALFCAVAWAVFSWVFSLWHDHGRDDVDVLLLPVSADRRVHQRRRRAAKRREESCPSPAGRRGDFRLNKKIKKRKRRWTLPFS